MLEYALERVCGGLPQPADRGVGHDLTDTDLARFEAAMRALFGLPDDVKRGIFKNDWVDAILEDAGCPISD